MPCSTRGCALPEAAPLLAVRDLSVSFRTEAGLVRAVDAVSFDIAAGEIVGVVGESGSGKTTLLRIVMGLINDPNAVITGSIRFRGRELVRAPAREMRKLRGGAIAMIFQDPMTALNPVHRIGWQIAEQVRAHNAVSAAAARKRAVELLAAVGIPNPQVTVDRYPHQLSGGMRQRAMIAMALSCNPALLIADEPTTALDVTVQAQILDLLQELRDTRGTAIVLITHDMGVIAEMADRVVVMYAGRKVEEGAVERILGEPAHPYTRGLLACRPQLQLGRGATRTALQEIPGVVPPLHLLGRGCAFAERCAHAMPRCREQVPPQTRAGAGQFAACWLLEPPQGREAA